MNLYTPTMKDRGDMSVHTRDSQRFPAMLRAGFGLGAFTLLTLLASPGCQWDLPKGSTSILQFAAEPTPSEAAAWALDKYDADKRYRGTLLLANSSFGGEPIYMELYLDNIKDVDPGVRSAATRAIARHGNPDQVPLLIERFADEDRFVRIEAARGLQRLHNPIAVDPLVKSLTLTKRADDYNELEPDVRTEAANALGQYPENRVIETLIGGLADPSLAVNRSSLDSLRTLTGQDFGLDRRAWLDWYDASKTAFAAQSEYVYPVFNREKHWFEYLPFVPSPNNEPPSTPIGMPRLGSPPG